MISLFPPSAPDHFRDSHAPLGDSRPFAQRVFRIYRHAWKIGGIWAALVISAGSVWADTPAPGGDSQLLAIDAEIQALKAQALDLNRDATVVEEDFLFPSYTRVGIDVSVGIPGLMLHSIKVQVDNNDPVEYLFNDSESIALLHSKGLFRLMLANATPGDHQLRADFSARYADAHPQDPLIRGTLDTDFVKDEQTRSLEVVVGRGTPFRQPELSLRIWSLPR